MLLQPLATAPAMWTRTQHCAPMRRHLETLKNVSTWSAALPDHPILTMSHEDHSAAASLTPSLPGCHAAGCVSAMQAGMRETWPSH